MEVLLVPKTSLPSGAPSTPQASPANNADSSAASRPILAQSAQAVTVPADIETPDSDRRRDRVANHGEGAVTPQQVLDSLRLTNRRTQLDFNYELDTVVLQVVDTRTEEVIETIPSEELIRQLKRLAGPPQERATGDSGGAFIDRSI